MSAEVLYDPPSGWRYGFPRPYRPLPGETVEATLIRNHYPAKDAAFGAKYCRFIGPQEALDALFPIEKETLA